MPISHEEAQELHGYLGEILEGRRFAGAPDNGSEVRNLRRALEIAALIVSDTDPQRHEDRLDGQEIRTVSEDDNDQELVFTREPMGRVRIDGMDKTTFDSVSVILTPESWDAVVNQMG